MKRSLVSICVALPLLAIACGSSSGNAPYEPPALPGVNGDSGAPGSAGAADATTGTLPDGAPGSSSGGSGDGSSGTSPDSSGFLGDVDAGPCTTTFRYVPPPGTSAQTVAVSGEWNAWAIPGVPMTGPDENGAYSVAISLPPGMMGYKFLLNGAWEMDPAAWERKFVGGVENSALQIKDCHVPTWTVQSTANSRLSAGAGHYAAHVAFNAGRGGPSVDPSSLTATLRKDGVTTPLPAPAIDVATSSITLDASGLADGKYTLFLSGKDRAGTAAAEPLRLVFWIEPETYDWRDALIYMVMTDRFEDGDPTNNPAPLAGVDPREQYQGGDIEGVTHRISDGTFDSLGVRALWLSPFNTNPPDAWLASDNVHETTGYHGYWAVKAREVDPRFGGAAALHAMVTAAHAHGIRVIQDFMVGDIHQEHEYVAAHPDWFRTPSSSPPACVCGTANCDWTVERLTCVFSAYLPRVDWTNPAVSDQWTADAVWWVDTFDLDGFRIDAVKQVQDNAITNVSWALRNEFERSGLKFFMTGETAMGWNACTPPDCPGNADNYGIISEYIGPFGLDGSFDFVAYYAVPSQVYMNDNQGMQQTDYWTQASQWEYPAGSIMSPYIGSEDTSRFVTNADTSGGDQLAGNQWSSYAGPPTTADAYGRLQMGMAWLLTVPGAPMMYYGDEYGQYGSVDPNNRLMWRGGGTTLTANEQTSLAYTKKLAMARKGVTALRRGAYVPVKATQDIDLFARQTTDGQAALVALSRGLGTESLTAALPPTLGFADGTTLHDRMGGPDVTVTGGAVTVSLPVRGAVILAP